MHCNYISVAVTSPATQHLVPPALRSDDSFDRERFCGKGAKGGNEKLQQRRGWSKTPRQCSERNGQCRAQTCSETNCRTLTSLSKVPQRNTPSCTDLSTKYFFFDCLTLKMTTLKTLRNVGNQSRNDAASHLSRSTSTYVVTCGNSVN